MILAGKDGKELSRDVLSVLIRPANSDVKDRNREQELGDGNVLSAADAHTRVEDLARILPDWVAEKVRDDGDEPVAERHVGREQWVFERSSLNLATERILGLEERCQCFSGGWGQGIPSDLSRRLGGLLGPALGGCYLIALLAET